MRRGVVVNCLSVECGVWLVREALQQHEALHGGGGVVYCLSAQFTH